MESRTPTKKKKPSETNDCDRDIATGEANLPPLPPNTKPLSHQVAGHIYGKSSSKFGMLECRDGTILKPLPQGRCGERELSFYECIWGERTSVRDRTSNDHRIIKSGKELNQTDITEKAYCNCTNSNQQTITWKARREAYLCQKYKRYIGQFTADNALLVGRKRLLPSHEGEREKGEMVGGGVSPGDESKQREADGGEQSDSSFALSPEEWRVLEMARHLTPTYLGTYVDPASPGVIYLRQDDVTYGFRRPCIADVKIGKQSYDPEASTEKIIKELNKYPPQQKLCFQLKGMRYYCREKNRFTTCSKEYLRTLDEESVLQEGFVRFFNNGNGIRHDVVTVCVQKLDAIIDWVKPQRLFAFYASSILIVYEGALEQEDPCCEQHQRTWCMSGSPASLNSGLARSVITSATAEKDSPGRENVAVMGPQQRQQQQQEQHVQQEGEVGDPTVNNCRNSGSIGMHQCVVDENWCCQQCWNGDASGPGDPGIGPGRGDPTDGGDICSAEWLGRNQSGDCKIEVKMIDFARVFPTTQLDTNYLEGLCSLRQHLVKLLEL